MDPARLACFQEPFGLTLIEAAAHGAPIVATSNGGPVDIISTLQNGQVVEPTDRNLVTQASVTCMLSWIGPQVSKLPAVPLTKDSVFPCNNPHVDDC
eukprot:362783-Chlamydomonas_euryale.AAC.7